MSWSVSASGKAKPVAAKLAKDFAQIKCSEPEDTIKNKVAEIVATALASFSDKIPVAVKASGSQSTDNNLVVSNSLSVSIEPHWNFIE
jgi:hypothetical protein